MQCLLSGLEADLTHRLKQNQQAFVHTFATADQKESMAAVFEKRKANTV